MLSVQDPFTSALNEFVKHGSDVGECEATDIKSEELCGVAGAELQANVRL